MDQAEKPRKEPHPSELGRAMDDILFGRIACRMRLCSETAVREALRAQLQSRKIGLPLRLGEILVRLGRLSPRQVRDVLREQGIELLFCRQCGSELRIDVISGVSSYTCNSCGGKMIEPDAGADSQQRVRKKDTLFLGEPIVESTRGALEQSADLPTRYQVVRVAGSGATSTVYKCWDTQLERLVALKCLHEEHLNSTLASRFEREAKTVAQLRHPHIIAIHEVGMAGSSPYISMDYISGPSLASLLETRQLLEPDSAARIVRQIADGLHCAHQAGVIHRDLKPGNILMDREYFPVLVDFGLAKERDVDKRISESGILLGTPMYMAPEQITAPREVSPRSDLFSLGVILYESLVGRSPFLRAGLAETVQAILNEFPPLPSQLNAEVPPVLEELCMQMMDKEPERRPASAAALCETLDALLPLK